MRIYSQLYAWLIMKDTPYYQDYSNHHKLLQLRRRVEGFESGEIYQKITKEYENKLALKDREIKRLIRRNDLLEEKNRLLLTENEQLKTEVFFFKSDTDRLTGNLEAKARTIGQLEEMMIRKDAEILHLKALLNTDGTNSGLPTSKTPLNKDKIRPNSRKNTGNPRGGVRGHKRTTLHRYPTDEINDFVPHPFQEDCPACSGKLIWTGKTIEKDETDIEVKLIKRRHVFEIGHCPCCGKEVHMPIPNNLKEENQYGSGVQAAALSLMNSCNVPINKVGSFLSGITDNSINPCDGYIAKLQRRAAKALTQFREDLRNLLIAQPILYWDDTVIMIDKARGCLRFYGNEKIAWYAAHLHKNMESILEDAILEKLSEGTYVMHDHNSINYNKEFIFRNLECNVHLIRDLQKVEQILPHSWAPELHELISVTIHKRKELMDFGVTEFEKEDIQEFRRRVEQIIETGRKQNRKDRSKEFGNDEFSLLNRIEKYYRNYFLWVEDFRLPISDSLSERALRLIKSKMKISGQFYSHTTADHYALIKSYIETCHRNGINEFDALQRLASGIPYTVKEIFKLNRQ